MNVNSVESDYSTTSDSLAEAMSQLSNVFTVPAGNQVSSGGFDPSDVDFGDVGSWVPCLLEVEGWLGFDEELSSISPEAARESLKRALVFTSSEFDDDGQLTEEFLSALLARVQMAVNHQEYFTECHEVMELSIAEATKRWEEAWEESATYGSSSGPVHASTTTWPLVQFVELVDEGSLDINPSFQRGDVWPVGDAQLLVESILRGIPLPAVILLDPGENEPQMVVDGKQRITTILRFLGRHPKAIETVKAWEEESETEGLLTLFQTDYPAFKKAWKKSGGEALKAGFETANFFPFKTRKDEKSPLSGELAHLQGKYYTEILTENVQVQGKWKSVNDLFTKKLGLYDVPVITFTQATRRQIHDVFGLYNRQGKKLNAEEIRNAVYHHLMLERAILVVAGDNEDHESVAPFLSASWDVLQFTGENLESYKFGVTRYKRTKVLAWVAAHLVVENGKQESTAKLIDSMFESVDIKIENNESHELNKQSVINDLMELLSAAIELHRNFDEAWDPGFVGGPKWQELQLVGSLLGVCFAKVYHGDELEGEMRKRRQELRALTSKFSRPPKTQTAQQWNAIAQWSLEIAKALGCSIDEIDGDLRSRFGSSGISNLRAALAKRQ